MLNTDLPEGSWQRQRFDAVVHDCTITAPPLAAFAGLVQPTPEQVMMLVQRSDELNAVNWLRSQDSPFTGRSDDAALTSTLREFYAAVDGASIVQEHAPEAFAEMREPGRSPGRPRTTPDAQLEPAPHVHGTPGGWEQLIPERVTVDADEASELLRKDLDAFFTTVHHEAFDSLDVGDAVIRTLSAAETATVLGVTLATLRNWRALGFGPKYLNPGKNGHRYPVFRIVEWLEESAHAASADEEGAS